jgi:RNA polymerase sigma-70 factor, ECF subfamily
MKQSKAPIHSAAVAGAGEADEAVLVRRAQAGDAAAFRSLYEAHFAFVLRSCLRLGLSEADAEDAVQETFLIASRDLARFGEGRLSTWLYRIAANMVSGRHRRKRVREALFSWFAPREPEPAPPPDRQYESREAARKVAEVLARLAPKKREVFALYELEGLSGEEIAARVGCPLATVWTRLHHARRDFERIARKRGLSEGT